MEKMFKTLLAVLACCQVKSSELSESHDRVQRMFADFRDPARFDEVSRKFVEKREDLSSRGRRRTFLKASDLDGVSSFDGGPVDAQGRPDGTGILRFKVCGFNGNLAWFFL